MAKKQANCTLQARRDVIMNFANVDELKPSPCYPDNTIQLTLICPSIVYTAIGS